MVLYDPSERQRSRRMSVPHTKAEAAPVFVYRHGADMARTGCAQRAMPIRKICNFFKGNIGTEAGLNIDKNRRRKCPNRTSIVNMRKNASRSQGRPGTPTRK